MKTKYAIKSLLVAFISIQLWFFYIMLTYPISGANLENKDNHWVVSHFDPRSTAAEQGLKKGDIIVNVNGLKADEYDSVVKWRNIDKADMITVSRDGKEFSILFKNSPRFSYSDILSLSGGMVGFFFALLMLKKMPRSQSARYLAIVFINIGGTFMSLLASARGDALAKNLILTLVMLLPVTFLNFLVVFLRERGNIQLPHKFLKYLYAVVLLTLVCQFISFTKATAVYQVYQYVTFQTILFFIFGLSLNLLLLSYVFMKHRKAKMYISTVIKTVWVSLFVSFTPIVIFSFVPEILYGHDWIDPIYMGWFILFFPLSFAYLIAAKRLYDIDIILRRIFYMTIISLIPSAVLVGLIGILFTKEAPIQKLLFIFILFVIILTFMLYSLEYFSTMLERIMFPKKYNLQSAVKKIAKNLSSISSFRELRKIILVDIVSTLQVFGGAVVFKYHDTIETISEGDIDIYEVEKLVLLDLPENTSYSSFEINSNEEYTSYLIMTQKKTNTLLGQEETQWLNLIISYMAVSLENVYLIRKLTRKLEQLASQIPNEQASNDFIWFRKLMFELQEKERLRIATDIHDTTMQDLFFLKRRLTGLLEKYAFTQADIALMHNCISFIDIINTNLRQNCFELHPHLLQEIGLVQTIEKVIELEMPISAFEIEFRATGVETIETRDLWTKRHIFRMVQELLNNAKKHSQASHVKIYIKATQANFHLLYEDNGIGYEPDQIAEKEIGTSGIGIEQMKSRVLSLNGHFDLDTSQGHGVKLEITFPTKEGKTA